MLKKIFKKEDKLKKEKIEETKEYVAPALVFYKILEKYADKYEETQKEIFKEKTTENLARCKEILSLNIDYKFLDKNNKEFSENIKKGFSDFIDSMLTDDPIIEKEEAIKDHINFLAYCREAGIMSKAESMIKET